jgi:hypothetical protein
MLNQELNIDLLQRSEEPHEGAAQMGRWTPTTPEIAMAELICR